MVRFVVCLETFIHFEYPEIILFAIKPIIPKLNDHILEQVGFEIPTIKFTNLLVKNQIIILEKN